MIPCKTFLSGEYAVLAGGPAIGLATRPGFKKSNSVKKYHAESAAGLYLKSKDFFDVISAAPGGFGKSTAEFLFAWLNDHPKDQSHFMNAFEAYLDLYREPHLKKLQPSGADLLIQSLGEIAVIDENRNLSKSVSWLYPELGFFILSTGIKIDTHDHIKTLDRTALQGLVPQARNVVKGYLSRDHNFFFNELFKWSQSLKKLGFLHPKIEELVVNLKNRIEFVVKHIQPAQFLIKPCGALGADVVLIIFDQKLKASIQSVIKEIGLQIVASELDLMQGIWESK